jgi:hypothetical protein
MANGTNSNSSSLDQVHFTLTDPDPNACISEQVFRELISRLQGTVQRGEDSVVYSATAPADKKKLWQPISSLTGIPLGPVLSWNPEDNSWNSGLPDPDEEAPPECLAQEDNAILRDPDNCLQVKESLIPKLDGNAGNLLKDAGNFYLRVDENDILARTAQVSDEPCNSAVKDKEFKLLVPRSDVFLVGAGLDSSTAIDGVLVMSNAIDDNFEISPDDNVTGESYQEIDLTDSIEFVEGCNPRYALVTAVIAVNRILETDHVDGTWSGPACAIEAGENLERVACIVDASSSEGAVYSTTPVKLNADTPWIFKYRIVFSGIISGPAPLPPGVPRWALNASSRIALMIKALVY